METVNNLTSAASRAIWGDPANNAESNQTGNETAGQEPLSGETGDVGAGEPYDKGNADSTTTGSTNPTSTNTNTTTDMPGNTKSTGPIRPEHDTDKTGVTGTHNPTSATSSDKPTSSNDTSGPGANPSVGADPSSAPQTTQKQQGADRPADEPSSEEHDKIKATKAEAEEASAVDTSGPSPKSLEDKARDGGGAVGASGDGEDDGPQKESHGEGTGEKWVKSSGMKAEGGDFDASAAGAGKEADRLLEQKGVHHTPGAAPSADEDDNAAKNEGEGKTKVSLKDKIKAKLHKN